MSVSGRRRLETLETLLVYTCAAKKTTPGNDTAWFRLTDAEAPRVAGDFDLFTVWPSRWRQSAIGFWASVGPKGGRLRAQSAVRSWPGEDVRELEPS